MLLKFSLFSSLPTLTLMQMNIEFGGDAVTQVSTAPAHHAISLEVRAVFYPLRYFAPLGFGQTRLTPRPGPVRQPSQAIRVVAMHPVAQRLPVHGTGLRGQHPRMPIQHHGNGQNARACLASAVRAASARNCEILRSWRVISIADMLPAPRNHRRAA